jgi:ferredoxin
MQTGPLAKTGFDISVTEIAPTQDSNKSPTQISYIFRAGSELGEQVLQSLSLEKSAASLLEAEAAAIDQNTLRMKPAPAPHEAAELLRQNASSSKWQEIESRCLSCANCTMVCPTCFCSTVEDVVNLSGTEAQRVRKWDSCFNPEFSYIHGGIIRTKTASRYRQWLTHKFSTWFDQFGSSGCVGCGRCITWCPVGIDVREEIEKFKD